VRAPIRRFAAAAATAAERERITLFFLFCFKLLSKKRERKDVVAVFDLGGGDDGRCRFILSLSSLLFIILFLNKLFRDQTSLRSQERE